MLLLQGTAENVKALENGNLFNIFGGIDSSRLDFTRAPLACAIFVLAILAATFNFASLPISVLSGAQRPHDDHHYGPITGYLEGRQTPD